MMKTEQQIQQIATALIRQADEAGRPGIAVLFAEYAGHHMETACKLAEAQFDAEAFATLPAEVQEKAKADAHAARMARAKAEQQAAEKAQRDAEAQERAAQAQAQRAQAIKGGNLDALLDALADRLAARSVAAEKPSEPKE